MIEKDAFFTVSGTLRMEGTATKPALLGAHSVSAADEGFLIRFTEDSADYDAAAKTGCYLEYADVSNVKSGGSSFCIFDCSPRFYESKFSTTAATGTGYCWLTRSGASIERCAFSKVVPHITGPVPFAFELRGNTFSGGYYGLMCETSAEGSSEGQIEENSFDCSAGAADLYFVSLSGDASFQVQNNHWFNGSGTIADAASLTIEEFNSDTWAGSPILSPMLSSAPPDIGPTW